jgi:hypothetical protein
VASEFRRLGRREIKTSKEGHLRVKIPTFVIF